MEKRNVNKNLVVGLLVVIAVLGYGLIGIAGSLEPSAGPGPTMKRLDKVEPRIVINSVNTPGDSVYQYIISNSGSYYLTGDVVTSIRGIRVNADNVTIDLMGYSLDGSGLGSGYGIYMDGRSNVQICNGTIRGFYNGIQDSNYDSKGHRIIDIRCVQNTGNGIRFLGDGHLVKDCIISDNGISAAGWTYAISVSDNAIITGNIVRDNAVSITGSSQIYGIKTGEGCVVTKNVVSGNGASSDHFIDGIYTAAGCTITGNTVYSNGASVTGAVVVRGIRVFGIGCTVTGNTAYDNGDSATSATVYGINLTGESFVASNTAFNNGDGAASATNMNKPGSCSFGLNHAP